MEANTQTQAKLFRFEKENDTLEGRLVSVRQSKFSKVFNIQTEQGEVAIYGNKVLESKIKPEDLGKQFPYKQFDVSLNGEKKGE
ncbi:MAG: hypothetical protein HYU39_02160 [Thaumarchaeota archaeon]|nr:hypothetical protein [Nitrososphaerota archaeon]